MRRWRDAMDDALYGPDGFFRHGAPVDHFRTSVHTGPIFVGALLNVLTRLDEALDRPATLDVVDIGAGRGELLSVLLRQAPPDLRDRLRPAAVEIAPHPADLDAEIAWLPEPPAHITGLILATEWLDNVPVDVVERDPSGEWRYVLVDESGAERAGHEPDDADRAWLEKWWPDGVRAEIGRHRDSAWAAAIERIDRGLALAIDYGHLRALRPPVGTMTGFRGGREVPPVPDGSSDLTAHVAVDAVAAAGSAVAGLPALLVRQAEALRALGVSGARPDIALAHRDPAAYVRALAAASTAAELTEPSGLGDHFWIYQPVSVPMVGLG